MFQICLWTLNDQSQSYETLILFKTSFHTISLQIVVAHYRSNCLCHLQNFAFNLRITTSLSSRPVLFVHIKLKTIRGHNKWNQKCNALYRDEIDVFITQRFSGKSMNILLVSLPGCQGVASAGAMAVTESLPLVGRGIILSEFKT